MIEETDQPTVDVAWSRVMNSVRAVGKTDFNQSQNFAFRGIDATINAVGPALREHGVSVIPRSVEQIAAVEYETKGYGGRPGTRMVNRLVRVKWRIRGPRGDQIKGESLGEAADSGDKGVTKAQSVAYRVFLLQALAIPTGDRDPDADSHERATASESQDRPVVDSPERAAKRELWSAVEPLGWTADKLQRRYAEDNDGALLTEATASAIQAFKKTLVAEAKVEDAGSDDARQQAVLAAQQELGGIVIEEDSGE